MMPIHEPYQKYLVTRWMIREYNNYRYNRQGIKVDIYEPTMGYIRIEIILELDDSTISAKYDQIQDFSRRFR